MDEICRAERVRDLRVSLGSCSDLAVALQEVLQLWNADPDRTPDMNRGRELARANQAVKRFRVYAQAARSLGNSDEVVG